ncbi:MAG: ammonia channel protein, partial [Rhodocyclaceae bacterium]|nr:ammonia channel protein [Rhodocyclaceae bacterium]
MNRFFSIMLAVLGLGISGFAAAETAVAVVTAVADAASAAVPAAEIVPTVHKGDVAWMMTATLLVVFMAVPGLALFYGGLVRAKNMLSVLMQVMVVFSLI